MPQLELPEDVYLDLQRVAQERGVEPVEIIIEVIRSWRKAFERARPMEALQPLRDEQVLRSTPALGGAIADFVPVVVEGEPLSETVIRERH